MTDPEMTELMQRCIELSPTLTWLNSPEGSTTVLWILGIELVIHAVVFYVLLMKTCALLGWLADKTVRLIERGWDWYRQKRALDQASVTLPRERDD